MEGHTSRILATCAVLVLLAACTPASSPPGIARGTASISATSDEALASELRAYMEAQARNLSFSGSVLAARRGVVLLQEGYGAADRRLKRPNTAHTQFRIASISKQFTAVGILLLQSQGKLDVQDRACLYLPDCPPAWRAITLHQLLTHTSGIPNLLDLPDYAAFRATPAAPAELIGRFDDLPLEFPPGEGWKYTDSGYVVLGAIIERVSGHPYERFLRDNIFVPLHMTNTGCLSPKDLATGYANSFDLTEAAHAHPTVRYAGGSLYSTVGDLYLWDQALFEDGFLAADLRQKALTPHEPMPDSAGLSYGYGFMLGELPRLEGHRVVGHTGLLEGYSSWSFYFPDEQVTLILLQNQRNPPAMGTAVELVRMILTAGE